MTKRPRLDLATILQDLYIIQVVAVKVLVVLVLAMMPKIKEQKAASAEAVGQLVFEARWGDGSKADVDLWVKAPLDQIGVGYSRRDDRQSAYLRDDTGEDRDGGSMNVEFAFCRTLAPGVYAVNVHLYDPKGPTPVRVEVIARINRPVGPPQEVARRTILLQEAWDEITAFSFLVGQGGKVEAIRYDIHIPIRGSTNDAGN